MVLLGAVFGFIIGNVAAGGGDDGGKAAAVDAARKAAASRQDAAVKDARAGGKKSGYKRGVRAGRKGERARAAKAEAEANGTAVTTTPSTGATGATGTAAPTTQPDVNPDCPSGQEPTANGGCQPYNDSNGQIEPKIDDPRCYSDKPPAGCF